MRQVILGCAAFFFVAPNLALADPAYVARSCSVGSDCVAIVNSEIAGLEGSSSEKDKAIADIVVAIGQESQMADRRYCDRMAAAVRASADSVSDDVQKTRIRDIATTMCANQIVTSSIGDEPNTDGGERNDVPASAN